MTCKRCDERVTTRSEFQAECLKHGIVLVGGNLMGNSNEPSMKRIAQHLEDTKGFQCTSCGAIFCMSCLYNYAPRHGNGGKACPECSGSFTYLL